MIDNSKKLPLQVVLAGEGEEAEEEDVDAPAELQREKPLDMRQRARLFLSKALEKYQAQGGQWIITLSLVNL